MTCSYHFKVIIMYFKSYSTFRYMNYALLKKLLFIVVTIVSPCVLKAQSTQQQYIINEWKDYFNGVTKLPQNDYKARKIYQQLVQYSGMRFPIYYAQTFQWGQAHNGGVILLDYSILAKSEDVLAFVMAHEWGHEALGHQANLYNPSGNVWRFKKGLTEDEDAADVYAGEFLAKYNYDISAVTKFLRNAPSGPHGEDTHSSGSKRATIVANSYDPSSTLSENKEKEDDDFEECFQNCIDKKVEKCIKSCTNYYNYSYSTCVTWCQPNFVTVTGKTNLEIWQSSCRKECKTK
jgi:hypothetical protein